MFGTPSRNSIDPMTLSVSRPNSVGRNSVYVHSQKKHVPTNVMQTFFHNDPFNKAELDKRGLNPERYEAPIDVDHKKFLVVDERVSYGKPLSQAEMQSLLSSRKRENQHQVVTYGHGRVVDVRPPVLPQNPDRIREKGKVEVVPEGKVHKNCCGC